MTETVITPEKLDELEGLAKKATPGPWTHSEQRGLPGHCFVAQVFIGDEDGRSLAALDPTVDPTNASADARFIAATHPATILALIARVRELEADRKAWKESTSLAQQQTDIWMNRVHELEQKCKEQS